MLPWIKLHKDHLLLFYQVLASGFTISGNGSLKQSSPPRAPSPSTRPSWTRAYTIRLPSSCHSFKGLHPNYSPTSSTFHFYTSLPQSFIHISQHAVTSIIFRYDLSIFVQFTSFHIYYVNLSLSVPDIGIPRLREHSGQRQALRFITARWRPSGALGTGTRRHARDGVQYSIHHRSLQEA